jgi:predicted nucleotidyltransferase component of viral defense system
MKDIVQKRLEIFNPKNADEEINALKEITQEIALYSLYKIGIFQKICFLGGTNLRIIHGLERFSEDLDFSTMAPDPDFKLLPYLEKALLYMNAYGYELEISGKEKASHAVQNHFLKDNSIKKILTFTHSQDLRTKIKIKVEVDTNPPLGANKTLEYVDFPTDFPVSSYDLPSLMAGKLHALLCRPYPKGRDWFDFLWYSSNNISPNLTFLQNALYQLGPWKNENIILDLDFLKLELRNKIRSIYWKDITSDVRKFLSPTQRESITLWGVAFFNSKIDKLHI